MMSSARDEQPDTVPPPAGEEDAYSAATKVGAMPAELMARLRAEGLLPDDDVAQQERSPRPSTALAPRPSPNPPRPPSAFDEVPAVHSDPPPPLGHVASMTAARANPASRDERPVPSSASSAQAAPVETPVAFATPPSPAPLAAPSVQERAPVSEPPASAAPVPAKRSKVQTIVVLVAAIVAVVGFAFAMALLSRRR